MEIREQEGYNLLIQPAGPTLGYAPGSTQLIEKDGCWFKDLSHTGELLPYEDWRLPVEERVRDLAARLSIEQIAGLMLYSNHQAVPATSYDVSTYHGEPYQAGVTDPAEVTDHQRHFLIEDNVRHVLVTIVESPVIAARWHNNVQALVEGVGLGIPVNNSSDPRHSARKDAEFNAGGGGAVSMWPGTLGLAATFSPKLVERFAQVVSREYRLMGFVTALSPQADLCTDPRWYRCTGTFGNDPELVTAMTRAYCDGLQTSEGKFAIRDGWGYDSVVAMVKHWPGGGPCEAGRDAHYGFGKYAVYPGNQFEVHKKPFVEGAFRLAGPTRQAAAVMPYYMIPFGQTEENVANAYNHEIITHQLREKAGYEGIICTDWMVTADEKHPGIHSGKPWGVEQLSVSERHYKALQAGVDQFGGNTEKRPVLDAYEMGVSEIGQEAMEQRMRRSAARLLTNMFRTGLFENPYIDVHKTATTVGCPDFVQEGYHAQQQSVVLLKNHAQLLPLQRCRAYIPNRTCPAYRGFWGTWVAEKTTTPVPQRIAERYFNIAHSAEDADIAIVFIESPMGGSGYDVEKALRGENGYKPITLQYNDYKADTARPVSIAGGDPFEESTNRTYRGQSTHCVNQTDLLLVQQVRKEMESKPVVVVINMANPMVMSEIEPLADAILLTFDIQNQAVLDIITGVVRPTARLPFDMPRDMQTVENHCEDMPHDMACYTDADDNTYSFGFGLRYDHA